MIIFMGSSRMLAFCITRAHPPKKQPEKRLTHIKLPNTNIPLKYTFSVPLVCKGLHLEKSLTHQLTCFIIGHSRARCLGNRAERISRQQ